MEQWKTGSMSVLSLMRGIHAPAARGHGTDGFGADGGDLDLLHVLTY